MLFPDTFLMLKFDTSSEARGQAVEIFISWMITIEGEAKTTCG